MKKQVTNVVGAGPAAGIGTRRARRLTCALVAVPLLAAGATGALARPLDVIKARGSVMVCANPNALPFSSKKGSRRGFELELGEALAKELGVGLEVGWVVMSYHVPRVDCDILFDTIVDPESAEDAHLRLSRPYNVSGVAIALRSGIDGVKEFGDLNRGLRVGALVGSVASVRLGQKGLQTIPFTFEDDMIEALGKGELDAALATPATIEYYNTTHKTAPLTLVRAYEGMPELRWEIAVGMRKADDALVAAVNAALDRMLAQGVVNRIYASYGIEQRLPVEP
jgi:polar amino acid transport system substrate-binding protein